MSTVPELSKRDEARILAAYEKVAQDPAVEQDPNAVIAKIAAADNIPAGHVNLLVRAYNTARFGWQKESSDDVSERAAEFPIASESEVIERLYPDEPSTGARREKESGISAEYDRPPSWYEGVRRETFRAKRASIVDDLKDRHAAYPVDELSRFKYAMAACKDVVRALEIKRLDTVAQRHKFAGALEKVAGLLEVRSNPAFVDLKQAMATRVGKVAEPVLAELARQFPRLEKAASRKPYFSISEHGALVEAFDLARAEGDRYVAKLAQLGEDANKAESLIAEKVEPFLPEEPAEALGEEDPLAEAPVLGKGASVPKQVGVALMVTQLRDAIDSMTKNYPTPNVESRVSRAYNKLNDPVHESRIRDVENQAVLQDMFLNDPIISGHDPHDIASLYNEVSRTAPNFAQQPLVTRPFLRRALEMGGSDTFEGTEAINTEHKLRQLAQPVPQPAGKEDAASRRPKTS
jgi:hypothetical protein